MMKILNKLNHASYNQTRNVVYVQGQSPAPKIREYFYYIDHQGMLYLDDSRMKNFTSCFKEKKFLQFFFKRLGFNQTSRYREDFPYVSLCGPELNYVRCDDLPIVFTHIIQKTNDNKTEDYLSYAHAGDLLMLKFEPDKIYMSKENGRIYHPAQDKVVGVGLVKSSLAIELSKFFEFNNSEGSCPTHFIWNGVRYELDQTWYMQVKKKYLDQLVDKKTSQSIETA